MKGVSEKLTFRSRMALAGPPIGPWLVAIMSLAIWAVLAFVYWRQVSIHINFVNDAFVFFDGIHRIGSGQVPHVDFSTPVGALAYWMLYLGYGAVGSYAGAVEVASLLLCAATLAIASFLLVGRASAGAAFLCLGTIAGVLVIPLIPGYSQDVISNSMHYNRWGWGLLLPLFLLALAPPEGGPTALSTSLRALCGSLLIVGLFYIKVTYFVVAVAFLPVLALYSDQRRKDALMVLAAAVVLMFATFLAVPSLIPAYIADILQAVRAGSGVTRDPYLNHALTNGSSILLLVLAVYAALFRDKNEWQDFVVAGYILVSSLAIIDQNFQFTFLVTLPAAFAILATNRAGDEKTDRLVGSVILAAGFFMVLPFVMDWARVTIRHLSFPAKGEFLTLKHPAYRNVFFAGLKPAGPRADQSDYISLDSAAYLRGEIPILTVSEGEYLDTLAEGVDLLTDRVPAGSVIVTFDYTNTLAPLFDSAREPNSFSWIHFGRNLSQDDLPPPERYFESVDFVMVPKVSRYDSASRLLDSYGPYMLANMTEIVQSDSWILLSTAAQK